ncbi:putative Ig domain-containing protein [uncultured Shewanella sp.]|uniref:putative Ig domain-containing protein n=1 Tax=uncultured Shewanella sp. TaxID=173975 RepID=UPI00261210A6|nr:putative Ig domain-containing protein [uncultured Shewanella sp.]
MMKNVLKNNRRGILLWLLTCAPFLLESSENIGDESNLCGDIGLFSFNRIANRTVMQCGAYQINEFSYSVDAILTSTTMEYRFHQGSGTDGDGSDESLIPSGDLLSPDGLEQTAFSSARGSAGSTNDGSDVLVQHNLVSSNIIFNFNQFTEYWIEASAPLFTLSICYGNAPGPDAYGKDDGFLSSGEQFFHVDATLISPHLEIIGVTDLYHNQVMVRVNASLAASVYWLVIPKGEVAPSAEEIVSGTDYASVEIVAAGNLSLTANDETELVVSGLIEATEYDLYFVANGDYLGCIAPKVSVTTPPFIEGVPPLTVLQDQRYAFTPFHNAVDANALTFSVLNAPTWMHIDSVTGLLSGTPNNGDVGIYPNIVLSVTDGIVSGQLPAFELEVINVNDSPVISGNAYPLVYQDEAYTFTPVTQDIDGDSLTFSIGNKPDWAMFDETTGTLFGTPTNDDVGIDYDIRITASDAELQASLVFTITVINVNDPPIINPLQPILAYQDQDYFFQFEAVDVDGDGLTFDIENKPNWASFNPLTGELTGTPHNDDVGIYSHLIVTVSDGQEMSSGIFSVEVENVNDPPSIVDEQFVLVSGSRILFTPSVVDIDDDPLTLVIAKSPTFGYLSEVNGQWYYQADADFVGQDSFDLRVQDDIGAVATAQFIVDVVEAQEIVQNDVIEQDEAIDKVYVLDVLDNDYDESNEHISLVASISIDGVASVDDSVIKFTLTNQNNRFVTINYIIKNENGHFAYAQVNLVISE